MDSATRVALITAMNETGASFVLPPAGIVPGRWARGNETGFPEGVDWPPPGSCAVEGGQGIQVRSEVGALLALLSLGLVAFGTLPMMATGAAVDVGTNATYGAILTDAQGFALYTSSSDNGGMSSCTGPCASVWPALTGFRRRDAHRRSGRDGNGGGRFANKRHRTSDV